LISDTALAKDALHISKSAGGEVKRLLKGTMRMSKAAELRRVPRETMIESLVSDIRHKREAVLLPVTVLYALFFAMTVLGHENLGDVAQIERELRDMMVTATFEGINGKIEVSGHKNLHNIDTVTDIWTYLIDAIIPNSLPESADKALGEVSRMNRYHRLIGGLVLQQKRKPQKLCTEQYPHLCLNRSSGQNPVLNNVWCYPDLGRKGITGCFGPGKARKQGFCPEVTPNVTQSEYGLGRLLSSGSRRLKATKMATEAKLGSAQWRKVEDVVGDTYSIVLAEQDGTEKVLQEIKQLRKDNWIDDQTAWVGIRFFFLQPDLGVYTHLQVHLFFLVTGEIIPIVTVRPFVAEPYMYKSILVMDSLWFLWWASLLGSCVWSLYRAICRPRDRGEYLRSLWTYIDWITAILGGMLVLYWLALLHRLDYIKGLAMDTVFNTPAAVGGISDQVRETYIEKVRTLHSGVSWFEADVDLFRTYIAFQSIFLVMRIFKAMDGQPKLAVVMTTLGQCMPEVMHFLIVFVTVLMSFAASAVFLFGHRVVAFSEIGLALEQCLLMLFGDFDWQEIADENPLTTLFWFLSFICINFLVMLNMVLAIFMDTYGAVKTNAEGSYAIWTQMYRAFMSYLDLRLVPTELILEAMAECPLELVTQAEMQELVPNLTDEQALELIENCEKLEDMKDNECLGLSDTLKLTVAVKETVHDVVDTVEEIHKLEQEENMINSHKKPLLHPTSERQLKALEKRVESLETFLNEGMSYMVLRGKEIRTRLDLMEKKLENQKAAGKTLKDVWVEKAKKRYKDAMQTQEMRQEAAAHDQSTWTRLGGGLGQRTGAWAMNA